MLYIDSTAYAHNKSCGLSTFDKSILDIYWARLVKLYKKNCITPNFCDLTSSEINWRSTEGKTPPSLRRGHV